MYQNNSKQKNKCNNNKKKWKFVRCIVFASSNVFLFGISDVGKTDFITFMNRHTYKLIKFIGHNQFTASDDIMM